MRIFLKKSEDLTPSWVLTYIVRFFKKMLYSVLVG